MMSHTELISPDKDCTITPPISDLRPWGTELSTSDEGFTILTPPIADLRPKEETVKTSYTVSTPHLKPSGRAVRKDFTSSRYSVPISHSKVTLEKPTARKYEPSKKLSLTPVPYTKPDFDYHTCKYYKQCHHYLSSMFGNNKRYFDPLYDNCYCNRCHKLRNDDSCYKRGVGLQTYGLPIGWARFGLLVSAADTWKFDEWHRAFHGTKHECVASILKHGLVPAGTDIFEEHNGYIMGLKTVEIRPGHILSDERKKVYVSPSIMYVQRNAYATSEVPKGLNSNCRLAFQALIEPDSYTIAAETIGASYMGHEIDNNFGNDKVEWIIENPKNITIYGLLLYLPQYESMH